MLDDRRPASSGCARGPQRIFHDGSQLRFVLDGDGDGCRADLVITDEGERSFANAKTFSGAVGRDRHDLLQQLPRGLPRHGHGGARRSAGGGGRRPGAGGTTPGACGAGTASSRAAASVARTGRATTRCTSASPPWSGPTGASSASARSTRGGEKVPGGGRRHAGARRRRLGVVSLGGGPATTLEDGGTTVVRIATIGGMIGVTAQRHGWESVGDVTVDGVPGGWGFLETTLNARNGSAPPGFVLGEAMTNGIWSGAVVRQPADDRALYYRQLRRHHRHGLRAGAHQRDGEGRGGIGRPDSGRVHRRRGVGAGAEPGVRRRVRDAARRGRRRRRPAVGRRRHPERFVELRRLAADVVADEGGSATIRPNDRSAASSSTWSDASSSASTSCDRPCWTRSTRLTRRPRPPSAR